MYLEFFNFTTAPFSIAPDPHYIYMSEHHQEGLAHLLYGINYSGGFVALTGEVGTGKTMLCHCLLEQLPENVDIALVLNPKLNTLELLATICDELKVAYDHEHLSTKFLIDNLNKHLLEAHALGWMTVLLIDEAQNLSLDVLEQIRLLTNLETSTSKLLKIILVGQPELKQVLEKRPLRQLNQRITARYHLSPLSYSDTKQYIKHRLALSGGNNEMFDASAMKRIFKLSKGIPRLINILADRALLCAYVNNTHLITAKIVKDASKEVLNTPESSGRKNLIYSLSSIVILITLVLSLYFFVPVNHSNNHLVLSGTFKKELDQKNSLSQPVAAQIIKPVLAQPQNPEPVLTEQIDQAEQIIKKIETEKILTTDKEIQKDKLKPLDFVSTIKQQNLSLNASIFKLAKLWGENISTQAGCKGLGQTGLRCLLDKSSWKNLIVLNRPVIMEFTFPGKEKHYALLKGLKDGDPVFQFDDEIVFSAEQVLSIWDGYYLLMWKSPDQHIEIAAQGLSSKVVLWIRKQLISNHHRLRKKTSVYFDEELKNEIIKFQQKNFLTDDGIVGPRTFIHLSNVDPQNNSPKLKLKF